jgi:hypothetical protein
METAATQMLGLKSYSGSRFGSVASHGKQKMSRRRSTICRAKEIVTTEAGASPYSISCSAPILGAGLRSTFKGVLASGKTTAKAFLRHGDPHIACFLARN